MSDARMTMTLDTEAAARAWAAVAEDRGATARHLEGTRLELTFPSAQAKEDFAWVLDVAVQTLGRTPGHA
jgi:hypothetical protein